jgi:hypothetical protein
MNQITQPSRNARQSAICNMLMLKMPVFTGLRVNTNLNPDQSP